MFLLPRLSPRLSKPPEQSGSRHDFDAAVDAEAEEGGAARDHSRCDRHSGLDHVPSDGEPFEQHAAPLKARPFCRNGDHARERRALRPASPDERGRTRAVFPRCHLSAENIPICRVLRVLNRPWRIALHAGGFHPDRPRWPFAQPIVGKSSGSAAARSTSATISLLVARSRPYLGTARLAGVRIRCAALARAISHRGLTAPSALRGSWRASPSSSRANSGFEDVRFEPTSIASS